MTSAEHLAVPGRSCWHQARWLGLLLALVGLGALAFVYLRGQDKNWDLLNYHFFAGYSLLHGNFLRDIAPTGLVSFLNPAPNVLAYLALSKLAFPFSAWAITLVQLLSLPLLALIGRQLGRELGWAQVGLAELLALALCLLAPLWWSEMGTTFSDASTAPLVLLGLMLGLRGVALGKPAGRQLWWAGVFFGLAAGLKLTNVTFALGFVAALLAALMRTQRWQATLRATLLLCLGLMLGFLLTASWHVFLMQRWGSPLFPLYNAWFKSPFADLVNFHETTWQFQSWADLTNFLWQSVWGTTRTAEFAFADPRLLIFLVLAGLALLHRKNSPVTPLSARVLLCFMLVSTLLWAWVFAIQRYLIPVELLLGLGIWLALARLGLGRERITQLLALCVLVSAALIKVPDWGHTGNRMAQANAFDLQLPAELAATPANYLVQENAISYILPFLHRDSRFYGVETFRGLFARQAESRVRAALADANGLPLRILLRQDVAAKRLWEVLAPFGLTAERTGLSCRHFRSEVDTYTVCELHPDKPQRAPGRLTLTLDLQDTRRLLPAEVLGWRGLSAPEAWGRWSDSDTVQLVFANCLPQGRFRVELRGHAFGPNVGQAVRLALGSSQASVVLGADGSDHRVTLENREACQQTLTLFVPQKISPLALGLSADSRQLGIGLVRLSLDGPDA